MNYTEAELRQHAEEMIASLNPRRLELAEKQAAEGLTFEETAEFDRLQKLVFEAIDRLHPRLPSPELVELESRIITLQKRLEGREKPQ